MEIEKPLYKRKGSRLAKTILKNKQVEAHVILGINTYYNGRN